MARSPGHQRSPQHEVAESHVGREMQVRLDGTIIADSRDVIRVDETGQPTRWYFSRPDVQMNALRRSGTATQCPFKGSADYFDLQLGGQVWRDAAWTYEVPYDEHADLQGRIAFHDDRIPGLEIVEVRP